MDCIGDEKVLEGLSQEVTRDSRERELRKRVRRSFRPEDSEKLVCWFHNWKDQGGRVKG